MTRTTRNIRTANKLRIANQVWAQLLLNSTDRRLTTPTLNGVDEVDLDWSKLLR
jgi:hypothetical protein